MNVSILEAAEDELLAASRYYVSEANREIAADFIQEFERSVDLLRKFPKLGVSDLKEVRKLPLRRFPFAIVYRESLGDILIVALAHHSRKPSYWRSRLDTKD